MRVRVSVHAHVCVLFKQGGQRRPTQTTALKKRPKGDEKTSYKIIQGGKCSRQSEQQVEYPMRRT